MEALSPVVDQALNQIHLQLILRWVTMLQSSGG